MAQRTPQNQEFRRIRRQLGLTQQDYGTALGISASTVSHYECGESQPPEPVLRLARLLTASQERSTLRPTPRQKTVGYPRGVPRRTIAEH